MSYYLEDHPNPNTGQYGWPRKWVSGVIGVHTTESGVVPSGADPGAENTAAFIARRTDYGSYHILADWDTIVPLTRPTFAAWADTTNNVHALSVSGAMNAARWRDLSPERAAGIVRNMGIAAAMLVRDAIAHGVLAEVVPARRITAQEAISGSRAGFYGHGETNPGTRYDPGTNFDWDLFLTTYAAAVGGGINYQSITTQTLEDDMGFVDDLSDEAAAKIARHVHDLQVDREGGGTNTLRWSLSAEAQRTEGIIARTTEAVLRGVFGTKFPRQGEGQSGDTDLGSVVSWSDANFQHAGTATLGAATGLDTEQVNAAIKAGVEAALSGVKATVTLGEAK